jgi:peptidyl-prolyl cis-trans isomerase C
VSEQPVAPSGPLSRARAALARLLREPLTHFVAIGVAAFALDRGEPSEERRVRVERSVAEALAREASRGAAITDADVKTAAEAFAREEVLVREARARGLDQGDPIVRRRLVQRLRFVLEAEALVAEPTDEELAAFVRDRGDSLGIGSTLTFEHVFFARTRADARADALAAKEALGRGVVPASLGDPFARGRRFEAMPTARAAELGRGVAEALSTAPEGAWVGPVEGALGHHLLRVESRRASRPASLAEAAPKARAALREEARTKVAERAEQALVERYQVELE